jgi:hypothetical protein
MWLSSGFGTELFWLYGFGALAVWEEGIDASILSSSKIPPCMGAGRRHGGHIYYCWYCPSDG